MKKILLSSLLFAVAASASPLTSLVNAPLQASSFAPAAASSLLGNARDTLQTAELLEHIIASSARAAQPQAAFQPLPTPEPATFGMLGAALVLAGSARFFRRKRTDN